MLRWKPGAAVAKMAAPCGWARGMNLYGIAAIPWFPSEVLKLATSDVQQPLGNSRPDTSTLAWKTARASVNAHTNPAPRCWESSDDHSRTLSGDKPVGVSNHGQR